MDMHETIRKTFEESGLSTNKLCRLTGLNYGPVYKFLHEDAGLRLTSVEKICEVLGLELRPVRRPKKG